MDFGEDLIPRTITYLLIFPTTFSLRRLQRIIVSGIDRSGVLLRAHSPMAVGLYSSCSGNPDSFPMNDPRSSFTD